MIEEKDQPKKPLRSTQNKIKDLYNTYVKNEGGRQIPITDDGNKEDQETKMEKDIKDSQKGVEENVELTAEEAFEELNKQINTLQSENAELKDQLLRKSADFENLRRRSIKERQDILEYSNAKLLENMLGLLDDIGNANAAAEKAGESGALYEGLLMIREKARKHFVDEGVVEINISEGDDFNVELHDAVMRMPHELEDGKIVQVVQKGYMIKDKVLRHAKVVTSAGPQE